MSTDYLLNDEYESDEDLPAVHTSTQKVSNIYHNKIRIIVGVCISGVSLLAMLILGILSSVYPAVYVVAPADANWVRSYTGILGFLKTHNLEWLFALCLIILTGGIICIFYSKLQPKIKSLLNKLRRKK